MELRAVRFRSPHEDLAELCTEVRYTATKKPALVVWDDLQRDVEQVAMSLSVSV